MSTTKLLCLLAATLVFVTGSSACSSKRQRVASDPDAGMRRDGGRYNNGADASTADGGKRPGDGGAQPSVDGSVPGDAGSSVGRCSAFGELCRGGSDCCSGICDASSMKCSSST